ncbi:MAG: PilZ domain-containing protein [Candidatus Eremiobacteraeota bacterium]|nr:PilZ domain-containing protein [Candidatus Eremiobacteraeota bacterium]
MAERPWVQPPSDRRQAPRFNISLPVTFTIVASGRQCAATVDNISLGGILMLTDEAVEHDERIVIHLPIAVDATINIDAAIVRTSSVGEVAVAFASLSDDAMDRLAEFVDLRAQRNAG